MMWIASSWPLVVIRPTRAPFFWMMVLVPTVVPCDRKAMSRQKSVELDAERLRAGVERVHHAAREIPGRGRDLGGEELAGAVHDGAVGERAADVDTDQVSCRIDAILASDANTARQFHPRLLERGRGAVRLSESSDPADRHRAARRRGRLHRASGRRQDLRIARPAGRWSRTAAAPAAPSRPMPWPRPRPTATRCCRTPSPRTASARTCTPSCPTTR